MIPQSSSDPLNLHGEMGTDDSALQHIWPGTMDAIRLRGFHLGTHGKGGATSIIVEATDNSSPRTVIIKICNDPTDPDKLKLFRREAKILATHAVPNGVLPQYYGGLTEFDGNTTGPTACQPFLVMERIQGRTITDYIADSTTGFQPLDTVRLVARFLRSVDDLHRGLIYHGDLSINNVLLEKGGRPRIIDLGQGGSIEKGYEHSKSVEGKVGTRQFSSADQLAGKLASGRATDLRQATAVAYMAWTKKAPGSLPSTPEEIRRWQQELRDSGVPTFVAKCLIRGLTDRDVNLPHNVPDPRLYATVGALADDLDRWCDATVARRRRLRVAATFALCLLPVVALAGHLWLTLREAEQNYEVRQVEELVSQLDALPNRNEPGVKTLLDEHARLREKQQEARQSGNPQEARRLLLLRRDTLRQTLATSAELIRVKDLHEPLMVVLNETPWIESAPTIQTAVEGLRSLSQTIGKLLVAGDTGGAIEKMAAFHQQLAVAARTNSEAFPASEARKRCGDLRNRIPERLRVDPTLQPIDETRTKAEGAWTNGDWPTARGLFGTAHEQLESWLKRSANPMELEALKQASSEEIERMRLAIQKFEDLSEQQQAKINALNEQIQELTADALKKQRALEAKFLAEETLRKSTEGERNAANTKVVKLEGDLKVSRQNEATLTQTKTELEKQLTAETKQRTTAESERDAERTQKEKSQAELAATKVKLDAAKKDIENKDRHVAAADLDVANWKKHAEESAKLLKELQAAKIPTPPGPRQRVDTGKASTQIAEGKQEGERLVLTLNGVVFAFRWCPPDRFKMGSPKNEVGRDDNDENQVDVTLSHGFWMLETEVTQKMWIAVMGSAKAAKWTEKYGKGDKYPAYEIDWTEAKKFGETLTEQMRKAGLVPSGWKLDLPSEAQWEYACRAGGKGRFCFGDDENLLGEYAWYSANSGITNHPVGTKQANAWGLYDLHGSVWEWTDSWYDTTLKAGTDPRGPAAGSFRVRRGGGAWYVAARCRSSYRSRYGPSGSLSDLGFRLLAVPVR